MKKNMSSLISVFIIVAGLMVSTASAELGLQQIAEAQATGNQAIISDAIVSVMQGAVAQGADAVGQAAQTAASMVYAANASPEVTQNQLSLIVSTAAASGNAEALRGAIVGVLVAGGKQNIQLGTQAINNSTVPSALQATVATAIASATLLITTSEGTEAGGGAVSGGGTGDVGAETIFPEYNPTPT